MENTDKILFDDQKVQWYVAMGQGWIGPFSASDLYQKILKQEITWAHFAWKAGQSEWKRICDIRVFQSFIPPVPSKSSQASMKLEIKKEEKAAQKPLKSVPPSLSKKKWFLHYSETQFGPFSIEEVQKFLRAGKIHGKVFCWCEGMSDWKRLEQIEDLSADVAEASRVRAEKKKSAHSPPSAPAVTDSNARVEGWIPNRPIDGRKRGELREEPVFVLEEKPKKSMRSKTLTRFEIRPEEVVKKEKSSLENKNSSDSVLPTVESETKLIKKDLRSSARKSLVARVLVAGKDRLGVAMCRDVSIGGMQVLTDQLPGKVGDRIKLNVSPLGQPSGGVEPFVAEGIIVRVLEDGRGFSFRFEKLAASAIRAIEAYLQSA